MSFESGARSHNPLSVAQKRRLPTIKMYFCIPSPNFLLILEFKILHNIMDVNLGKEIDFTAWNAVIREELPVFFGGNASAT